MVCVTFWGNKNVKEYENSTTVSNLPQNDTSQEYTIEKMLFRNN